jgi:hypothetical protein
MLNITSIVKIITEKYNIMKMEWPEQIIGHTTYPAKREVYN